MSEAKTAPIILPLQGQTAVSVNDIPVTNPDNVRTVYSNNINVAATSWDFHFIFTELVVDPMGLRNEMRAKVAVTPALAKLVAKLLVDNIALWEKDNGEIKFPKGIGTAPPNK